MSITTTLLVFQNKGKHRDLIQRCHPTFFTLYISILFTSLCHASLIDAFDPNSQNSKSKFPLYIIIYIYIYNVIYIYICNIYIYIPNTRLCFVWHVVVLTTFLSSTKMWNCCCWHRPSTNLFPLFPRYANYNV